MRRGAGSPRERFAASRPAFTPRHSPAPQNDSAHREHERRDPDAGKIPFWTLFATYLIQVIGELCLSPIGLSMFTKLAPVRLVGLGMGGWFLSIGIGNNLSGIFASEDSGETGMTIESALSGYTFGFWALVGSGVLLFLIAPLIERLMDGVK